MTKQLVLKVDSQFNVYMKSFTKLLIIPPSSFTLTQVIGKNKQKNVSC